MDTGFSLDFQLMGEGALLHDVGKTTVPRHILKKRGRHTEAEFEQIKKHPIYGRNMLLDGHQPVEVVEMAWRHHQRPHG